MDKKIRPTSFHLQWHITERCNFRCKHCYIEDEIEELPLSELSLILNQYIDMIRIWELDKNNRPRKLSIGGGEPFVRKDLFDLLEKIKENKDMFTSVGIMSNGSLITKDVAKRLKNCGISGVQISLEGTEKVNDKIRGKESFKRAVNGIKNLMEAGIPVGVSVTIHRENYRDFSNLLDFLKDLGVKSIGASRFVPIGIGKNLEILQPKELKKFYSSVISKKKKLEKEGVYLSTHCSDSLWFIEDQNYGTHGCSAGYDSFSILPNGDVVPCRRLPVKVGNVLEKSLIDIWYTSDFLWKLRNKGNISVCKNCELFTKCFGGARCVAYGYFDDILAPDPQCWKLFKSLSKKITSLPESDESIILNESYTESFD
jgi:radical SAM protein with 4Fe4S-binding SPASM domain